ncbi:MAG: tetratricopeptide repeat protein [Bacteroidales bacterium]
MPRRILILIVSIIFVCSAVPCQESDSTGKLLKLENQLLQSSSEEKFEILFQLADKYFAVDTEKAKEYSMQAIHMAKDIQDSANLLRFYHKLGEIYFKLNRHKHAIDYYKKAIAIQEITVKDTNLLNLLIDVSDACQASGQYEEAESFLLDALAITEKNKAIPYKAYIYFYLGNIYHSAGKFQEAIRYLKLAENEIEQGSKFASMPNVLNNLGIIYYDIGAFDKALEYYLKAIDIYESNGNKTGVAGILNNIGIIYYDWGNKEKALEYYQKSLRIEQDLDDYAGIAGSYNNIGIIYSEWDQNELAITYYKKALDLYFTLDDSLMASYPQNNIGESYAELGFYDSAFVYLKQALELEQKFGNILGVAESLQSIGNVHYMQKNYRLALNYNQRSFQIADSAKFSSVLKANYELFYKIYNDQNDYKKALDYFIIYETLKDSAYNEMFLQQLANLQIKHEIDRREQERKLFENEFRKKEQELISQRTYLIAIFILMIIFGMLVYYDIKSKIKANEKLKVTNAELTDQKAKLSDALIKLKKSETKYRNLVENSPTGILYIDSKGNVIEVNKQLLKILGSPGEEETKIINCLEFEPLKQIGLTDEILESINTGKIIFNEKHYHTKWGKNINVKYSITPIKGHDGMVNSLIINIEDISAAKESERLKYESEEKYRILVENSLQAMVIIQDNRLIFGNSQFEKLTHYRLEELSAKGGAWLKLIIYPEDFKRSIRNVLDAIQGTERTLKHEYRIVRKDGKIRWIDTLGSVIMYQGNRAILLVAVDITERKLSEEILINSEKKLKEANAMKDKFFSIVAHDLKNPFSSILGFSNLLYEAYENFEEKQRKTFIKNICEAAENTFKLLQNLLEWSRTQTGNIEYDPKMINLYHLVNENLNIFKSSLTNKKITTQTDVPPGSTAFADENMINTVLRNLISNAIKFTNIEGSIKISVISEGDTVNVNVRDNGIGIDEENLSKLFRIDDQYRSPGTLNEAGSGLGLLLCKEFIEINHGQIKAESIRGDGSIFSFSLPRNKPV